MACRRGPNGVAADFNTEPRLDVEAALLLARADVALVGADIYAVAVLPSPKGEVVPVHQRLLRDDGMPLLEGLVLKPLADAGATESLSPPPRCRSSAAPARLCPP